VDLRCGVLPKRIEKRADGLAVTFSNGANEVFDQVLVATGRAPNTRNLGLETIGVELDQKGAVRVDAGSTSNVPSIHAVGDVTDRINLTPVAIREGHVLADRLFGGGRETVDHDNVATAVFTTPEIGTVGLTEKQALERHEMVDIYRANFRPMKGNLSSSEERTIMKLIVEPKGDRILGAHILGGEAGEIIQTLAIAIKMGATKHDLDATMAVHPTAAEELVTMRTRTAQVTRDMSASEAEQP
jgi:glutathione reductase (NADPH)